MLILVSSLKKPLDKTVYNFLACPLLLVATVSCFEIAAVRVIHHLSPGVAPFGIHHERAGRGHVHVMYHFANVY